MSKLRRREAGLSVYRDWYTGRVISIIGTFRCVHCQMHVDAEPEALRTRGWCQGCDGPTCGKPTCATCVHWEQRLENIEAGRDELFKPIRVAVPTFNIIAPEVFSDGKEDVQPEGQGRPAGEPDAGSDGTGATAPAGSNPDVVHGAQLPPAG